MKSFESISRRSFAASVVGITIANSSFHRNVLAENLSNTDKFRALSRPALYLRNPQKSVLLSVTQAGKRLVAVGERGVVILSDDSARTWRQAKRVPVSVTLTAVRFFDSQNGLVVGHGGVILRTDNAGEYWEVVADGRKLASLTQAVAQQQVNFQNNRSQFLAKEANLLVQDGPDKPLLDLCILGDRRAVAVGAYNLFYETLDGGLTWISAIERLDNPMAKHLYAIRAIGKTWMIAGEQGLLLCSRDSGRSFKAVKSPYEGSWFALATTPNGEWILAGLRGNVFYTSDAGTTWRKIEGAPPVSFVSAVTQPDGAVLLANQAGELFSSRGGAPLQPISLPAPTPLSQALIIGGGDIIAVGMNGAMRLEGKKA